MKLRISHNLVKKLGFYKDKKYLQIATPKDQIIAEYPKSGVTYLSVLLGNLYVTNNNEINYYNVNMFIQDRHFDFRNNRIVLNENISIIKSHFEYTKSYRNIIHLFREPVDVMVSYYNYFSVFSSVNIGSFSDFIRSRRGVQRWKSHSLSYLGADLSVRYFPLSYKRAVESPTDVCKIHACLLGVNVSDERILRAVRLSSKDTMYNLEKHYLSGGRSGVNELFTGVKKFSKEDVNKSDLSFIKRECASIYDEMIRREDLFFCSMQKYLG